MNGYCKLNMDCSPLLPSCEKVIWVLSKCIRAGLGAFSKSKYRGVFTSVRDTCHQTLLAEIRSGLCVRSPIFDILSVVIISLLA